MDEPALRRLLDSALLTGACAGRPVLAPAVQIAMMLDALATLPPRARAVVVLRYWADLSVEQAADFLGCSTHSVLSDNAFALAKLKAVLDDVLAGSASGAPRVRVEPGVPHRG
jgi:hypothetical protein